MSEENVEVVRRFTEAFNGRDLPAMLRCCDADIELDFGRVLVGTPTYRGHEGIERWFRDMSAAWEELQVESFDVVAFGGDEVVVVGQSFGSGKTTGAPFSAHFAAHCRVSSGKAVRAEWFTTEDEALEAAGLSE